jgi:hypothetical protein
MLYFIRHYELHETQPGYYERRNPVVHGEEFGGDRELFETPEQAAGDFRNWLLESGFDSVRLDGAFLGWGVVYRCDQQGHERLISLDVLPVEED